MEEMKFLECESGEDLREAYMEYAFNKTSKADKVKKNRQRKKDIKKNPSKHKKALKKKKKRADKVKRGAIKVDKTKSRLMKKIAKTRGK